ncbi:MAG: hypothetical protein ACREBE_29535, partial [bacterium]
IPIWFTTPADLAPAAKARLNGNVQGVLTRGEDALAALRGWLETGRPSARPTIATRPPNPDLPVPSPAPDAQRRATV